jgi:serine/threonine-protein kinase
MDEHISAEFIALQQHLAGRYSIERELGRGGMGIVLLARDVALDRLVAIKLLPRTLADNTDYRDRFLREARTAAGLSHPNIVPIHTVEESGDLVFFVMGYVEGETLRERVEDSGPLTPRLAMKFMQEVAWALGYAHQRGVVHRDIKPDNIMIEEGTDRALVTDFGIAIGRRDTGAGTGEVIGTARYMSPEQACGETVDARSDLYSLAATFFFALTGRAPFEGKNLPAIMALQVTQPAPEIAALRPEVPARLAQVIDRCLEKEPEDRLQTGEEVAQGVGEARGRDFRAPPLVRSFVRNAQVSTMVFLAGMLASNGGVTENNDVRYSFSFGGIIGFILLVQLVRVARRLLREGYTFDDIREALLAEAAIQEEESQVLQRGRWMQRLDRLWYRLWAGWFGRRFFQIFGWRVKQTQRHVLPSHDATEMVLGRSTIAAFEALPNATRREMDGVPAVIDRLENRAEALRRRGQTGRELTDTVAALENLRVALLKLKAGAARVEDLTGVLEEAKEIGAVVDREVDARAEVDVAFER